MGTSFTGADSSGVNLNPVERNLSYFEEAYSDNLLAVFLVVILLSGFFVFGIWYMSTAENGHNYVAARHTVQLR